MFAIEFKTQIKDGVVHIPEQYKELYQSKAKIVVLLETDPKTAQVESNKKAAFFKALSDRHISVEKNINIDGLMQDINNGIC